MAACVSYYLAIGLLVSALSFGHWIAISNDPFIYLLYMQYKFARSIMGIHFSPPPPPPSFCCWYWCGGGTFFSFIVLGLFACEFIFHFCLDETSLQTPFWIMYFIYLFVYYLKWSVLSIAVVFYSFFLFLSSSFFLFFCCSVFMHMIMNMYTSLRAYTKHTHKSIQALIIENTHWPVSEGQG